ncbi:hypothetical protein [Nannocystis pusilla]|uniref:hypothetical protein n=1 Tax=Nannocystis pusilla TaxID=889268 RepID=UPI003DA38085
MKPQQLEHEQDLSRGQPTAPAPTAPAVPFFARYVERPMRVKTSLRAGEGGNPGGEKWPIAA